MMMQLSAAKMPDQPMPNENLGWDRRRKVDLDPTWWHANQPRLLVLKLAHVLFYVPVLSVANRRRVP